MTVFDPQQIQELPLFVGAPCGVCVPPGWHRIVRGLHSQLMTIDRQGAQVQQIKSKFGGLRVYMSMRVPGVDAAIEDAENACAQTCMVCGYYGKLRQRLSGWQVVACDDHVEYA